MRRRKFLMLLGGAAVSCPLAARAQQAGKRPTVAFVLFNASSDASWRVAFSNRLRELGWTEGRNVAIDYRWSEGRPEHVAEIAAELVQQKVHVIVTYGAAVPTLRQATTSIPIVLIAYGPVGSGLVASLCARHTRSRSGLFIQSSLRKSSVACLRSRAVTACGYDFPSPFPMSNRQPVKEKEDAYE